MDLGGAPGIVDPVAQQLHGVPADGPARAADAGSVAEDIRVAEMLIARRAVPDPSALADASVTLKSLLRA